MNLEQASQSASSKLSNQDNVIRDLQESNRCFKYFDVSSRITTFQVFFLLGGGDTSKKFWVIIFGVIGDPKQV